MSDTGSVSTHINGEDLVVEWRIADFSTLDESDGAFYLSPEFSFGGEGWFLWIDPNGSSWSDSSGHVDLRLSKHSSGRSLRQSFSLSLKTAEGNTYREEHVTKHFDEDNWKHEFNRFIPRAELTRLRSDLLPDDVLTVVCTIKRSTCAGRDWSDPEHAYVGASTHRTQASTHRAGTFARLFPAYAHRVRASTEHMEASAEIVEASTEHMGASADIVKASTERMGTSAEIVKASTQIVEESIQIVEAAIQTEEASIQTVEGKRNDPEHAYVGASTHRIQASTHRARAFARRIPASAYRTRAFARRFPASAHCVRAPAQHLGASTEHMGASAEIVKASAEIVEATTEHIGASAQTVEASIQTVEAATQTVEVATQTVEVANQTVEVSIQVEESATQTQEASIQTVEEKRAVCASGSSTNSQEKKALHDYKELFLEKEECDVTIRVKGSEFPAHKAILRARSPVLASTFRHDMKESATGVLEIDDCDPSSFSDFLCFLYCADVQLIGQSNVFDLFTLADKYQVLDLRSTCLEFVKNNPTVDTFCETITLALRHSEPELIQLCTDYFKKNAPKIIVTVKWQTFLAENPTESNELFIQLLVPNSS